MNGISIYEFDALAEEASDIVGVSGLHGVPNEVYKWLEDQSLRTSSSDEGSIQWLRISKRHGRRAVQVTSFVGVVRAPNGFQIEVLPKVGKAISGGVEEARRLLIEMLCCLQGFRHIQTHSAKILAVHMPLLEVFIAEFLRSVQHIVKRGLRSAYASREDNLFALRGKLLVAPHLRQNLFRADRFFTEHDEYSIDRPENRLLHSALRCALKTSASQTNQQLARELAFVFADVPVSAHPKTDFQRVRLDRGMGYYADALDWSRIILEEKSPLTGSGEHHAPSLMFPMETVFEAFVAKHLRAGLAHSLELKTQVRGQHLVRHLDEDWFRLKPDLMIRDAHGDKVVLDTKWKLLDGQKSNAKDKYGLSQADFYQLHAYGQNYLNGSGDVVLIYPKTESFERPLKSFDFLKTDGLRLWVLPFCLASRQFSVPDEAPFKAMFSPELLTAP